MTGIIDRVYRSVSRPLSDHWLGGLHTGLVIKGLYLQWQVADFLRSGSRRVLDVGCGPKVQMAAMLARRYPSSVFMGMDLHLELEARDRAFLPVNLSVVEADVTQVQKHEVFDLVYSVDVLEHIDDIEGVLDRLVAALRPGGRLVLHTPSLDERRWLAVSPAGDGARFRAHRSGDDHVHEGFSLAQLTDALTRRSIIVLDARPTFGRWVSLVKELFSWGESRGVKGIGLLLLPVALAGVLMEMVMAPQRGNGSMVVGKKPESIAA